MNKCFKKGNRNHYGVSFLKKALIFLLVITRLDGTAQTTKLRDNSPTDKYIGTIVNIDFFENPGANNASYDSIIKEQFNGIVAENNYKMFFIYNGAQTSEALLNMTEDDINKQTLNKLMDYGKEHSMVVRGHALMWHSQSPEWFETIAYNWTDAELKTFATRYITAVMTYCKNYTNGKVDEWDVFNEVITDGVAAYRKTYKDSKCGASNEVRNVWFINAAESKGGEGIQSFIDHCFNVAKSIDPEPLLFYNDYNIEYFNTENSSKNKFMREMVKDMKARGVKIDGVGLQSHFTAGEVNALRLGLTMDDIIGAGLICNVTELDIRICGNEAGSEPTAEQIETQASDYKNVIKTALSKEGSTGLVIWGFSDATSWIPQYFCEPGNSCDHALLYDKSFEVKPSYTSVLEALNELTEPIEPEIQSPFNGAPLSITDSSVSIIEFENFDNGGNGVAYLDSDSINEANDPDYRPDVAVDIFSDELESGILTGVGYTSVGEWLEYTVDVAVAGLYNFDFVSTSESASTISLKVNDVIVKEAIALPNTGGWAPEDFVTTKVSDIQLSAGEQVFRISVVSGYGNFDKILISKQTLNVQNFNAADNLVLYPMPFQNNFTFSFNGMEKSENIEIFDINGRLVHSAKVKRERTLLVSPALQSAGVYFLKTQNKVIRIIKN